MSFFPFFFLLGPGPSDPPSVGCRWLRVVFSTLCSYVFTSALLLLSFFRVRKRDDFFFLLLSSFSAPRSRSYSLYRFHFCSNIRFSKVLLRAARPRVLSFVFFDLRAAARALISSFARASFVRSRVFSVAAGFIFASSFILLGFLFLLVVFFIFQPRHPKKKRNEIFCNHFLPPFSSRKASTTTSHSPTTPHPNPQT